MELIRFESKKKTMGEDLSGNKSYLYVIPTEQQAMQNRKLVTGGSIDMSRIAFLLEEIKIATFKKDNVESDGVAGFGVPQKSVELHVTTDDFDRAKKFWRTLSRQTKTSDRDAP